VRSVPVIVDSHLRLDGNFIGHDLANEIFDELTIYNHAKDVAQKMNRWGWQELPDDFLLASLEGDTVVMPRGYAYQLKTLLRERDIRVQWEDHRQWRRGGPFPLTGTNGRFKPHQIRAIRKIIKHQQGMYEAPTGSGKTVTCIGFIIAKQPKRTLILTDRVDLLNQWRKELAAWLGVNIEDIGQIGQGEWNVGARVTVATVQTIWSAIKQHEDATTLIAEFFSAWDCVIIDECHHVTAETIEAIVGEFNAKYRFGVSATTDRKDDRFEFALNTLGEVFHKDDEKELRAAGVLMRPRVKVIRTKFGADFWPDHESDEDDKCMVPTCKLSGKRPHWHRNNYQNVKTDVLLDADRNFLICETIWDEVVAGPHHHLIVCDEIRQLEALYTLLLSTHPHSEGLPGVYVMTGRVKGKERVRIKAEIEAAPEAIVFATVAKEGLDIPAVDRIYLPSPSGNPKVTQQKIGRGTRIHEGKLDIIVFDFFDILVDIFRKQFRKRRFQCYDQLGLEVDLGG